MSRTIALPVLIIFLAILDARASADDDVGVNVRFYVIRVEYQDSQWLVVNF